VTWCGIQKLCTTRGERPYRPVIVSHVVVGVWAHGLNPPAELMEVKAHTIPQALILVGVMSSSRHPKGAIFIM
jgi:hypothetical protein